MTLPTALNAILTIMMAKFVLNDVPHAVGLIGGSSHQDNPTDRQIRYITQLSMQLGIRTPLEERPETQGDAGRLIRELEAERDRRKRTKSGNPTSGFTVRRSTVEAELDALERARSMIAHDMSTRMQSSYNITGSIMGNYYDSKAVVVEKNRELVGIATYSIDHNFDYNTDEAHIQELASLTNEPGVGKAIVKEIVKIAREQNANLVTVSYGPGAKGFYVGLGFTEDTRYVEGRPEALVLKLKPQNNPAATGTCFPDAGRFVTKNEEGTLIHGTVMSKGKRIDHAWVEVSPEYVWEPQTKQYMTKKDWLLNEPIEEARYDSEQAAILVLKNKNWGPWT